MRKTITAVFILYFFGSLFVIYSQSAKIDVTNALLVEATTKVNSFTVENAHLKVVNAVLVESSGGLLGTKKETWKEVGRVIDFILATKSGSEAKFGECVDRKIKTTSWGSDGPQGLLDECIDTIKNAKSAILSKEIDTRVDMALEVCGAEASGRFDRARWCWADSNHRLLSGANRALFYALTTPDWPYSNKSFLGE